MTLMIEWLLSRHASRIFRWQMIAVFVTPMALIGVSVVNRVSTMSDDATLERGRSILHRTVTPATSARDPLPRTGTHLLYEYTTNPRLDRYLQSNSKQPKTYKALYQMSTRTVTRARLLQNR